MAKLAACALEVASFNICGCRVLVCHQADALICRSTRAIWTAAHFCALPTELGIMAK